MQLPSSLVSIQVQYFDNHEHTHFYSKSNSFVIYCLKNAISEQVWEHENNDSNNLNGMAIRVGQQSSLVIQPQMYLLHEPFMPNMTGEGVLVK
jgi:hypothetical protein